MATAMTADELFTDGNRLYREDLYWAALLRYRQASDAGMATALLHYNTGVAHYRAGQHLRAREQLLKALDSPGLRVAAQYNLGLNAYKIGERDEALRWFRLARDQHSEPKLAGYARVAVARILSQRALDDPIQVDEEKRRETSTFKHLELRARLSFGTDDNVFRTPGENYIDFSDPVSPLVQPEVVSGAYMPFSLSAKYRIDAYQHEGFFGAYRLAGRYYQDKELDNANEYSHELSFGSEYRFLNEVKKRERALFSAFTVAQHDQTYFDPGDGRAFTVDDERVDDRMNYLRYGPELVFRQSRDKLAFGLNIKGQLWNYDDTELTPEYDHEFFEFGLMTQYQFTSTSLLRIDVEKSSRRYGDRRAYDLDGEQLAANETLRYDLLELGVTARQRIWRKFWFGVNYRRTERSDKFVGYNDFIRDRYGVRFHWDIGYRFGFEAHGAYMLYNFPRAYAYNNPALPRKTLERINVNLTASYRLTRHLYLVLEGTHSEVASNDTRIAYDRNQYVLGVRWSQ